MAVAQGSGTGGSTKDEKEKQDWTPDPSGGGGTLSDGTRSDTAYTNKASSSKKSSSSSSSSNVAAYTSGNQRDFSAYQNQAQRNNSTWNNQWTPDPSGGGGTYNDGTRSEARDYNPARGKTDARRNAQQREPEWTPTQDDFWNPPESLPGQFDLMPSPSAEWVQDPWQSTLDRSGSGSFGNGLYAPETIDDWSPWGPSLPDGAPEPAMSPAAPDRVDFSPDNPYREGYDHILYTSPAGQAAAELGRTAMEQVNRNIGPAWAVYQHDLDERGERIEERWNPDEPQPGFEWNPDTESYERVTDDPEGYRLTNPIEAAGPIFGTMTEPIGALLNLGWMGQKILPGSRVRLRPGEELVDRDYGEAQEGVYKYPLTGSQALSGLFEGMNYYSMFNPENQAIAAESGRLGSPHDSEWRTPVYDDNGNVIDTPWTSDPSKPRATFKDIVHGSWNAAALANEKLDNLPEHVRTVIEPGYSEIEISGGGYRNAELLNTVLNKEETIAQLQAQAEAARSSGDMLGAAEIGARIAEMENKDVWDEVNELRNPLMEAFVGLTFPDPLDPVLFTGIGSPSMRAPKNIIEKIRLGKTPTPEEAETLAKAIADSTVEFLEKAGDENADMLKVWQAENSSSWAHALGSLFRPTPEAEATRVARDLQTVHAAILSTAETKEEFTLLMQGLYDGKIFSDPDHAKLAGDLMDNERLLNELSLIGMTKDELFQHPIFTDPNIPYNKKLYGAALDNAVWLTARRNLGLDPISVPLGTTKVGARKGKDGKYIVEWKNKDGEVIKTSKPYATKDDAMEIVKADQEQIKGGVNFNPFRVAGDAQRAILTASYLDLSPSHWFRNFYSGTAGLVADDSLSFTRTGDILEEVTGIYGHTPGVFNEGVTKTDAGAVKGSKWNPLTYSTWVGDKVWRGTAELGVGNVSVPFGESAMRIRAGYRAMEKTMDYGTKESVAQFTKTMVDAGVPPDVVQPFADELLVLGRTASNKEIVTRMDEFVGAAQVGATLSEVGVDPTGLPPSSLRRLHNILTTHTPDSPGFEAALDDWVVKSIGNTADTLTKSPPMPGRSVFSQAERTSEATYVLENLYDSAVKAGMDKKTASVQSRELTKRLNEAQVNLNNMVLAELTNNPDAKTLDATLALLTKGQEDLRKLNIEIDRLSNQALKENTPEAWAKSWEAKAAAVDDYSKNMYRYAEDYDLNQVTNAQGTSNIDTIADRVSSFDAEGNARTRDINLGPATTEDDDLYKSVINANRAAVDNSVNEMLLAFAGNPSEEFLDMIVSADLYAIDNGTRTNAFLAAQRAKLAAGEITQSDYIKIRNDAWRKSTNDTVLGYEYAKVKGIQLAAARTGTSPLDTLNQVYTGVAPTADDIRSMAALSGRQTAHIKQGTTMVDADRRLLNSIEKNLGIKVRELDGLDDLSDTDKVKVFNYYREEAQKAGVNVHEEWWLNRNPTNSNVLVLPDEQLEFFSNADLATRMRGRFNDLPPSVADGMQDQVTRLMNTRNRIVKNRAKLTGFKANGLDNAQRVKTRSAVREFTKAMDMVRYEALKMANESADFTMLNYGNQYGFDNYLSLIFGYHTFATRMPFRWAQRAAANPSLLYNYWTLERTTDMHNEQQENMPTRARNTLPNPIVPALDTLGAVTGIDAFHTAADVTPNRIYKPWDLFFYYPGQVNMFIDPEKANNDFERGLSTFQRYSPGMLPSNQLLQAWVFDKLWPREDGQYSRVQELNMNVGSFTRQGQIGAQLYQANTGNPAPSWLAGQFNDGLIARSVERGIADGTVDPYVGGLAIAQLDAKRQGREGLPEVEENKAEIESIIRTAAQESGQEKAANLIVAYLTGFSANDVPEIERDIYRMREEDRSLGYSYENPYGSQAAVDAFRAQNFEGASVPDNTDGTGSIWGKGYSPADETFQPANAEVIRAAQAYPQVYGPKDDPNPREPALAFIDAEFRRERDVVFGNGGEEAAEFIAENMGTMGREELEAGLDAINKKMYAEYDALKEKYPSASAHNRDRIQKEYRTLTADYQAERNKYIDANFERPEQPATGASPSDLAEYQKELQNFGQAIAADPNIRKMDAEYKAAVGEMVQTPYIDEPADLQDRFRPYDRNANGFERAESELLAIFSYEPAGKPEWPGDDATSDDMFHYWRDLGAYENKLDNAQTRILEQIAQGDDTMPSAADADYIAARTVMGRTVLQMRETYGNNQYKSGLEIELAMQDLFYDLMTDGQRQEQRAAVETQFGSDGLEVYDRYAAMPKGPAEDFYDTPERVEYREEHPELKEMQIFAADPAFYNKMLKDGGDGIFKALAEYPSGGTKADRTRWYKSHSQREIDAVHAYFGWNKDNREAVDMFYQQAREQSLDWNDNNIWTLNGQQPIGGKTREEYLMAAQPWAQEDATGKRPQEQAAMIMDNPPEGNGNWWETPEGQRLFADMNSGRDQIDLQSLVPGTPGLTAPPPGSPEYLEAYQEAAKNGEIAAFVQSQKALAESIDTSKAASTRSGSGNKAWRSWRRWGRRYYRRGGYRRSRRRYRNYGRGSYRGSYRGYGGYGGGYGGGGGADEAQPLYLRFQPAQVYAREFGNYLMPSTNRRQIWQASNAPRVQVPRSPSIAASPNYNIRTR